MDIQYPIEIKKGITFCLPIEWKDENEAVIDFSDWSAVFQIRETSEASEVILEGDETDLVVLSDVGYNVLINIPGDSTKDLQTLTSGVWGLKLTKEGENDRYFGGPAIIVPVAVK